MVEHGEQQLVHPCSSHILWGSNHLRYIEASGLAWSWAREPQGHQGGWRSTNYSLISI